MTDESLKILSLEELLILLSAAQKNLDRATLYKHGADVVQQNKTRLEIIQKTIVEKGLEPSLTKK